MGPQGLPGIQGPTGPTGPQGISSIASTISYVQPSIAGTVNVTVNVSSGFSVGQIVFVTGGGYYQLSIIYTGVLVQLTNLGYSANALPGVVIGASQMVPAGIQGANPYATLTTGFTQPLPGASVTIDVTTTSGFTAGQTLYINAAGYYSLTSIISLVSMSVRNLGYTTNVLSGNTIISGQGITPAGLNGILASTTVATAYTQPAVSVIFNIPVSNSQGFVANMEIFVETGGYYQVLNIFSNLLEVKSTGVSINAVAGTIIPIGATVNIGIYVGPLLTPQTVIFSTIGVGQLWTFPSNAIMATYYMCPGGGGGGGGGQSTTNGRGGGGGSGGAGIIFGSTNAFTGRIPDIFRGSTFSITINAGGLGGNPSSNGVTGSATSISIYNAYAGVRTTSGALYSTNILPLGGRLGSSTDGSNGGTGVGTIATFATGGGGGGKGASGTGSAGGAATGALIRSEAGAISATPTTVGGRGGRGGMIASAEAAIQSAGGLGGGGGNGGGSPFGGQGGLGGISPLTNGATNGQPGQNCAGGGGGSGATRTGGNSNISGGAGGQGGPGLVMITYYI